MFTNKNANRFRAVLVAMVITVGSNYLISYVANASPQSTKSTITETRSGATPVPNPPKPTSLRSGATPVPNPPRP